MHVRGHSAQVLCFQSFARFGPSIASNNNDVNFSQMPRKYYKSSVKLENPWRQLYQNHGVTQEQYETQLEAQKHCCAICGRHESECSRKSKYNNRIYRIILHVDHNHETEQFRGLLCHRCNTMLGYADENPQILQNAISYLAKHGARERLQAIVATKKRKTR